jgi:hypothetical protein
MLDEFEKFLNTIEYYYTKEKSGLLYESCISLLDKHDLHEVKMERYNSIDTIVGIIEKAFLKLKNEIDNETISELNNVVLEFITELKKILNKLRLDIMFDEKIISSKEQMQFTDEFTKIFTMFGIHLKNKLYKIEAMTNMRFDRKLENYS